MKGDDSMKVRFRSATHQGWDHQQRPPRRTRRACHGAPGGLCGRGQSRGLCFAVVIALVVASGGTACAGGSAVVTNHSFARSDEAVTTHLDMDIVVDFTKEQIRGRASLHIDNKTGTDKLYLDTRDLAVGRVTLGEDGKPTSFRLGKDAGYLGQALIIDIAPDTKVVNVYYETTGNAKALDWLQPSQTADGTQPFLYTQGQAILNRTWIPCQDNTGIRITYHARVRVPPGMMVVMSARNPTEKRPDGVYEFDMPQPIPPYLIAMAVGDLEFRAIGARSGVYAEPSVVEKAAWEFADTETMIELAAELYGPYRWERFDVIVLPPSFPYGGMENPRLTFLTPVLVAGDRSLVSTIAHELAHSWSGNLVTNATWSEFWLNEGFTTYFERRIMEAVYGREAADMNTILGFTELEESIADLGADHDDTRLHNDITGRDPDEGMNTIPYEKGYMFLRLIEEKVGRAKFDNFLREYFEQFAFQTMTSKKFVAHLRSQLIAGDAALEAVLRIDEWVYEPGLPDNHPQVSSTAYDRVLVAVDAFMKGEEAASLDTDRWSGQQWKQFLQKLPRPLPRERLADLEKTFGFTEKANAEVRQVWFLHAIASDYEPAYPAIERYLTDIGRIWLIGSVYRQLSSTPQGLKLAKRVFAQAKTGYHPLAVVYVERILNADD
jgi:aminopeptidase N